MPNYELERALDTTAVCVRCGDEDRVEVMHKHLVNDGIAYLCDDCEDKENNMKNTIKVIKFPKLLNKLIEKGHSEDRAAKIILEAEQSSNPAYILNYYGIKISEVCEK